MLGKKYEFAQPQVIVIDLLKCIVHVNFTADKLYDFVKNSGRGELSEMWDKDAGVSKQAARARRHVTRDKTKHPEWEIPGKVVDANAGKDEMVTWLHTMLVWYIENGKETPSLLLLKQQMWTRALTSGKFKTSVYREAVTCMNEWKKQGIKLLLFSEVSIPFQQSLLKHTTAGDLNPLFDTFFDYESLGDKEIFTTFTKLAEKIATPIDKILVISGNAQSVRAAKDAGAPAIIVISHPMEQFAAIGSSNLIGLDRIRSFSELKWEEKDPPDEAAAVAPAAPSKGTSSVSSKTKKTPVKADEKNIQKSTAKA